MIGLVTQFQSLFSDVPGRTKVLKHDVKLINPRPIKQHAYCANSMKRNVMKGAVEFLLQHGLAKPSSSPWNSPCLIEGKANSSPRFITDFRKVNAVTVRDSYPLPRMEDCVDTLCTVCEQTRSLKRVLASPSY